MHLQEKHTKIKKKIMSTGDYPLLPESFAREKKMACFTLGVTLILIGFMKLFQSSFDKSEKWHGNLILEAESQWYLRRLTTWFIKKKIQYVSIIYIQS